MNRKFFINKVVFPATILFICFIIASFIKTGSFVKEIQPYVVIYFFILFIILTFWGLLELAQKAVGELMEGSWSKRIIFIIAALLLIYLYKSTGRI